MRRVVEKPNVRPHYRTSQHGTKCPAAARYRRALGDEPRRLTVRTEHAIRQTSDPWRIGREVDCRKIGQLGTCHQTYVAQ
jgi:hypothetical protein